MFKYGMVSCWSTTLRRRNLTKSSTQHSHSVCVQDSKYPLFLKEQKPKEKEDAHHQYVLKRGFDACFGSITCSSFLPFCSLTLLVKQPFYVISVIEFHVDAPFSYWYFSLKPPQTHFDCSLCLHHMRAPVICFPSGFCFSV